MQQIDTPHESTPDRVLSAALTVLGKTDQGMPATDLAQQEDGGTITAHLLYALFRHRAVIDWILDHLCNTRRSRRLVLNVLRVGCCQLLYQKGIPPQIVTDTCVRHVRRRGTVRESGFVNAVLRRLIRETAGAWRDRALREGPPYVRHQLSEALYRQWSMHFDAATIAELAHVAAVPAPLVVRRRRGTGDPTPHGCTPLPAPAWAADVALWSCRKPAALFTSELFRGGAFYVQDPSTLLAPQLAAPRPGETVADLCCAPGGKCLVMADRAPAASILACDHSKVRLARLRTAADMTPNLFVAIADAIRPPFQASSFDAVLLDVPCSNTGVLRRRPDVRWTFSRTKLKRLAALQKKILAACRDLVKPGGRLVYSTCSIEPEENQWQIRDFLAANADFLVESQIQLLPCSTHDGAYAALLVRAGESFPDGVRQTAR